MTGTEDGDTPVLQIEDLAISFRTGTGLTSAVTGVDLTVRTGETVAIVGESGSGKSTTAAAVNRLLADNAVIERGIVRFEGRDITTLGESGMRMLRGASIGLVPQDPMSNLDPLMRIGDQIAEALVVHGLAQGGRLRERVIELLDLVGIPDPERRIGQYPHEFSGGMRQRVLIAIGLACRPRLLIADEPTSALDVTVQRRILDRLDALTDELGTAVLLITHDLALAAERADRIAVMYRGQIVEQGAAGQILEHPEHDYTRSLLAAIPGLHTELRPAPTVTAAAPLLQVTDLVMEFPVRGRGWRSNTFTAVAGVSLEIAHRTTVSLVGESGSGKSTVANVVLGLLAPTSGRILFDGTERGTRGEELRSFRRRVQPVFQNPFASLDPRFTVARSIAEPLQVHRIGDRASRRRRVDDLLDLVALSPSMADRLPHELSGGQRQRVAIARALALNPDLVVLDEAVSALDVLVQEQVLRLLDELQRELGLAYLFISHDLAVVRMISDFVHVMHHGRVVESGTPEQIFSAPREAYTQELLAAVPGSSVV